MDPDQAPPPPAAREPPLGVVLARIGRAERLQLGTDPPANDCALAPSPAWDEERAEREEDDLDADAREIAAAVDRGEEGATRRLRATHSLRASRAFTRGDRAGAWAIWEALLAEEPRDPDPLISRSLWFGCADDLDSARTDLDRAVAIAPRAPEVFRRRASCHVRRHDWARALADNRRLVNLCPRDVDALKDLAACLRFTDDEEAAIRVAGRAIKLAPWRGDLFELRAACWGHLGKRAEQRRDLDRWIAVVPRDASALRARASYFLLTGDKDAELADLSRVLEIEPDHVESRRTRARIFQRRGEPERAIADLDRVAALAPDDLDARRSLAELRLAAGALTAAIADLDIVISAEERARAEDPDWRDRRRGRRPRRFEYDDDWAGSLAAEAYVLRGHAHRRNGDRERALADYRAAIAAHPDVRCDLEEAVEQARKSERPAEQLDLLDALVLIAPEDVDHLIARAELLHDGGRDEEALADLDRAIPAHRFPHEALALRAKVRWSLHDLEGALADLDRAVAMAPRAGEHHSDRGYYRVLLHGHSPEAEADMHRAVELDPLELRPRLYLAFYLERCRRWAEAVEVYDTLIAHHPRLGLLRAKRAAARLRTGRSLRVLRAALGDYDAALAAGADEAKTRPERDRVAERIAKAEARARRRRLSGPGCP
jgi:tetratricopeptide (TPR) repeat protein